VKRASCLHKSTSPQDMMMRRLLLWAYSFRCMGLRIAQLVKNSDLRSMNCRASLSAGGVFFWYGALARLSLQISSMAPEDHTKNDGEVPTNGYGSRSLHGCQKSTSPFSLRVGEFSADGIRTNGHVDWAPTKSLRKVMENHLSIIPHYHGTGQVIRNLTLGKIFLSIFLLLCTHNFFNFIS